MNLVIKAFTVFNAIFGQLKEFSFSPVSTLVATSILVLIAFVRILIAWNEASRTQDFLTFARESQKMFFLWIFVTLVPGIMLSLNGYVQGRIGRVFDSQGTVATNGQKALDETVAATKAVWALRAPLSQRFTEDMGVGDARAVDNLDNFLSAQESMRDDARARRKEAVANKKQAELDAKSSNPKIAKAGQEALRAATDRIATLDQLDAAWKAAAKPAQDANAREAKGQGAVGETIGSTIAAVASGGTYGFLLLYRKLAAFFIPVLVIGVLLVPLILAGSAVMGLVSTLIGLLSRLLALGVAMVVAGAMGSSLAPMAVVSFASQSFSRFGWNWLQFWLQVVVVASGLAPIVGLLAKGLGAIATYTGNMVVALQSGSLATQTISDFWVATSLAALAFVPLKALTAMLSTVLDKGLAALTGPINGQFHP